MKYLLRWHLPSSGGKIGDWNAVVDSGHGQGPSIGAPQEDEPFGEVQTTSVPTRRDHYEQVTGTKGYRAEA